ncbi:tail length tape measure protein [Bacillus phage BCASJ1c]|uniref:Tail tape measure protein n=1 Tax=Bacillus phage BCASJ1c TaxID=294382 RepID=Q5YA61_9CAUD|nr:tail length tape measure protein [Bacillus phage BCASJ1c]AAU85096.1 tail tape measure protein [Bacillus phage BCASJ1c]
MSDGRISIDIEVDGKQVGVASKELDRLEASGHKSGKGVKEAEDGLKGVSQESAKAGSNIKKFATAIGLVAIAAGAFKVLRASLDDAIARFDTLNQFPKVMEQVGFSTDESTAAVEKLRDGVTGLPTPLQDVVSTARGIAVMTKDLDGAVDTTLALNNAFLASGSSTGDAQRGLQQYLQMLAKGEVDLQSWRTLQETMGLALNEVAESFGFAGESAQNDLYAALQSGEITFKQFNARIIELDGAVGGFAERALTGSEGISTSMANLRTATVNGVAAAITALDNLSRDVTGNNIAQNIDGMKDIISASFNVIVGAIESSTPYVQAFAGAVGATLPVVQALSPVLIGMASAYAMHAVINTTIAALKASQTVTAAVTAIKKLYTLAVLQNAHGHVTLTAATHASAIATRAKAAATTAATAVELLFTRQITLAQLAMLAKAAAANVLGAALRFMSGPIGWVTLGIGALVGAVIGVVKWFNRASEESERLNAETEELGTATDTLIDSVNNTSKAYQDSLGDIEANSQANKEAAERIEELAAKENKSAAEKRMLQDEIESLNGRVDDLNLSYDEEADALNMSSEQLEARVDIMKEEESLLAARERQVEISKEINDAEMQLKEINALREEWNQKLEEGSVKSKEHKEAIAELDEQEQALTDTLEGLSVQQAETEDQITTSTENITAAIESGNLRQITSYEDLEDHHKKVFDNMAERYDDLAEHATNAFDKMNDESKATAEEMIENLEHNQEMTRQWSENVAELYDWAGKEGHDGFLQWLETMGPESAAELQVVRDMSDDELKRFAELMDEGANVATDSLKTSLGEGLDEAVDVMINFVDDGSSTLRDQITSSGFDEIGNMIPEGIIGGIEDGTPGAAKASEDMAIQVSDSFKSAAAIHSPSRVFEDHGVNLAAGVEVGITKGTAKVVKAIQNMFKAIQADSARSFSDITRSYDDAVNQIDKSLAKLPEVTQKSMQNMLDRLRNGAQAQISMMRSLNADYDRSIRQIETNLNRLPVIANQSMTDMLGRLRTGAQAQVMIMRSLSRDVLTPFNSTPAQFNRIGQNIMAGLNAGINARRGQVMSTVRGIANEITRTMQRAQRINSPGREMRDKVGKWIPEGVAVGIRENAKTVYRELEKLSTGMTMAVSPEQAAGVHRMAYTSGGYHASGVKNSSPTTTKKVADNRTNDKQPAVINVYVGSKQVASEIVDDITSLQNRKSNRKRRYPKGGGAFA